MFQYFTFSRLERKGLFPFLPAARYCQNLPSNQWFNCPEEVEYITNTSLSGIGATILPILIVGGTKKKKKHGRYAFKELTKSEKCAILTRNEDMCKLSSYLGRQIFTHRVFRAANFHLQSLLTFSIFSTKNHELFEKVLRLGRITFIMFYTDGRLLQKGSLLKESESQVRRVWMSLK